MEELLDYKKLLNAHRLVLFCLERSQKVEIDICNTVIEGLCKLKKHSEAFSLYNEQVELRNHQQLSFLVDFEKCLRGCWKVGRTSVCVKEDDCSGLEPRDPEVKRQSNMYKAGSNEQKSSLHWHVCLFVSWSLWMVSTLCS